MGILRPRNILGSVTTRHSQELCKLCKLFYSLERIQYVSNIIIVARVFPRVDEAIFPHTEYNFTETCR